MAKIAKTTKEEKKIVPLKKYTRSELVEWDNKFKGLNNNEKGVIFGVYRKEIRHFPASKYKPDPKGYDVPYYFVRPDIVPEFENLIYQIGVMHFADQKKDAQLQATAEEMPEWDPSIKETEREGVAEQNWFSTIS